MLAGMRTIALVVLIAALPLQAFAAIATPHCRQDVAAAHEHAQPAGHQHDGHQPDAPAHGHEHPLTSNDLASDHCDAGSVFALPAASVRWAGGSAIQCDRFTPAHCFGFVPEQPQRPPLA
ncbi:MAG: hypothetical protein WBO23_16610 [Burkholderiales bacterium]